MQLNERLIAIRKQMEADNISAYLIPSADPHGSEYLANHYKCLAFASGFTGSAGTLLITPTFAGLWTDSRYFIQAEKELKNSGFELVKLLVPHRPEYIDWLAKQLDGEERIAFDDQIMPADKALLLKSALEGKNITYCNKDYLSPIWEQRPAIPHSNAVLLNKKQSGKSVASKLRALRAEMNLRQVNSHLISSLDDIAWLMNIRGNDIPYNPVVMSHALISQDAAILYLPSGKLSPTDQTLLIREGIRVAPYETISAAVKELPASSSVLIDTKRICYFLYASIPSSVKVVDQLNPTALFKALKNQTEQDNFREAMLKDGVAMTQFVYWLENNVGNTRITELSAAEKLRSLRAVQKGFIDLSFGTIPAYAAHGALPHYSPTEESDVEIKREGLFLLDSGGQYHFGTTDITRTIPFGKNTPEEIRDYTLVLKALIEGSSSRFPTGTCGYQLDAIIRKPLWEHGINYGHGTGHGIGYFLNVHEGPQNISPSNHPIEFKPGMITSIEPGIYRPGKHGVRIENVVLTVENSRSEFGCFYSFETLTLAHIDTTLVDKSLLNSEQIQWLNQYNQSVYHSLSPLLTAEESSWLGTKTTAI